MLLKHKYLGFLFVFYVSLGSLAVSSCSANKKNDKLKIVTTIFPQYDWAKNVVGEIPDVDIQFLVNNGIDLHSYQPY